MLNNEIEKADRGKEQVLFVQGQRQMPLRILQDRKSPGFPYEEKERERIMRMRQCDAEQRGIA